MTFLYTGIFWNSSIYLCLVWRKSAKIKILNIYNVYGTVQNWMLWKSKNIVNNWIKLLDFHKIQEFQNWKKTDKYYMILFTAKYVLDKQNFRNEDWNMKSFGCLFNTWFIYYYISYNINLLVILLFSFDLDEWY
jgi:hypothetical protein